MFEGKKKKELLLWDGGCTNLLLRRRKGVCVCRQEEEEQGQGPEKTGPGMAKMCREHTWLLKSVRHKEKKGEPDMWPERHDVVLTGSSESK